MAEPPLAALLDALRAQVAESSERDMVLDAGSQLAGSMNQNAVRALAGKWNVRQKVDGNNRTTTDIRREVEENVNKVAKRLLQIKEGAVLPEPAAEATAVLPEPAAEAAAVLPEPAAEAVAVPPEPAALEEPVVRERSRACKRARSVARMVAESGTTAAVHEAAGGEMAVDEEKRESKERRRRLSRQAQSSAEADEGGNVRVPTDVLAPLQTGPVLKAVEYLETLPAQHGVDQLREVLQQWRSAGIVMDKQAQRSQLRQVAAELGVSVSRAMADDPRKVSHAIADGLIARVSALRMFVVPRNAEASGSMAATAAVAAQAAARWCRCCWHECNLYARRFQEHGGCSYRR